MTAEPMTLRFTVKAESAFGLADKARETADHGFEGGAYTLKRLAPAVPRRDWYGDIFGWAAEYEAVAA